ncbi:uncharacterized protein Dwil_GK11513 [Drosophila willistoni]|uniref:Odorant receptor n=1 Tax=Drosophila willistoni TaxID=7260 RepID=B4N9A5_DROWI|nr:odorant receptor 85c [Drosophila willistoni]EDW80538.2 uncharacterized protein Dwil_GK11513 [Drosophila willistoni]
MDNFLKYANFFYKAVGIEPYARRTQSSGDALRKSIVYWANVINLSVIVFGEVVYVGIAFASNRPVEAIMVMSYIGFVAVGMSKMIIVWLKKPDLSKIMDELHELYPRGEVKQREYKLERYLRSCSRISLTFSTLYSVLIWTYNLFSIMQFLIYELWLQSRVVGQTLPYLMYTPWNWEGNWTYYVMLFCQNFAGYTSAAGQISTDLLLVAVATQVVMHFDYLARSIEGHELAGNWETDSRFLSDSVQYHERLFSLASGLNDIFGVPLLLNFMISSFVICFVGFQMTVGVPPDLMVKLVLFLVSSLCQILLICYYGQLIADSSSGISWAAYKQNWNYADVRYRRALAFIIARAQKPAYLRATIFMRITMGTMTDLLQISYKFFALLRTMYAK